MLGLIVRRTSTELESKKKRKKKKKSSSDFLSMVPSLDDDAGCRAVGAGGAMPPPQILADQITLFQLEGR